MGAGARISGCIVLILVWSPWVSAFPPAVGSLRLSCNVISAYPVQRLPRSGDRPPAMGDRGGAMGLMGSADGADEKKKGPFSFFKMPKVDRAQLAALGASAALAYGFVSNVNMIILMNMAWITFGKKTGLSPLDLGQWPNFLLVYGGFYVASQFLRPARMAIAVAITPAFDRIVAFFQARFRMSKTTAFTSTVFFVNVVGNISLLLGSLFITSSLFSVPFMPTGAAAPKVVHVRK